MTPLTPDEIADSNFRKLRATGGLPDGIGESEAKRLCHPHTRDTLCAKAALSPAHESLLRRVERFETELRSRPASLSDSGNSGSGEQGGNRQGNAAALIIATPFVWRDPSEIPPRQFVYGKHYVRKHVSVTIAPGGLGKSSLDLVEALAMASGRPLLGGPKPKPRRVWYFNLEDPRVETERRIAAICLHHGIEPKDFDGRLFVDSGRETPLIIGEKLRDATVVHKPIVAALIAELKRLGVDVLIIDPFVSCHRAPENDNGAIDMIAKTWGDVADATNCAVELVHHVRKPSGGGSYELTIDDARGASAFVNAARSVRVLNVMSTKEAVDFGIPEPRRRAYFRVDNGKASFAPPEDKADWHKFISVPLNNPTNEDPADSVGVVLAWEPPNAFDGIAAADVFRVQTAVTAGVWREDIRADNWVGKAIADTLNRDLSDPKALADIKTMLKTWLASGALKVVLQLDEKRRERKFVVVGQLAV
jgi:hypothetical protein